MGHFKCIICEKTEPAPDRGVYLAHGNGGAYSTAPAHSSCVQAALDAEQPVGSWNEDPGWYVRGAEPGLPGAPKRRESEPVYGPWRVEDRDEMRGYFPVRRIVRDVTYVKGVPATTYVVAEVGYPTSPVGTVGAQEREATAKLMAAAPELLKALKAVLRTGLNGGNNLRLAFMAASRNVLSDEVLAQAARSEAAVAEARLALAKAGEEES